MPRKTPAAAPAAAAERACFNEAAARCRGKRVSPWTGRPPANSRFNEAAARCRGKPDEASRRRRKREGFNEAAARCRGKRPGRAEGGGVMRGASMRPRPDAAENAGEYPLAGVLPPLQ